MDVLLREFPPEVVTWGTASVPLGKVLVGMTDDGHVCRVTFLRGRTAAQVAHTWQFDWERTHFKKGVVPKDFLKRDIVVVGTEVQRRIWMGIMEIPKGSVLAYGEVAELVELPGRARAVGRACRESCLDYVVPCHRVVAAGGLGGYGPDGLDFKQDLLKAEGISMGLGKRRA